MTTRIFNNGIGEEIAKHIKEQSQQVFNLLYIILGIVAGLTAIICGIMIIWSKNDPERRNSWIKAMVAILVALVALILVSGLINLILEFLNKNQQQQNSNMYFINLLF